MLRFTDPNSSPAGDWFRYKQEETGFEFEDKNLNKLIKQVKVHRLGNNIPIGINIEAEIENIACKLILEKYPDYKGIEDDNGVTPYRAKPLGITQVLDFLKMAAVWMARGAKFVDQAEANRRAEICVGCPMNQDIGQCITCGAKSLLRSVRGGTTPLDGKLFACSACGCYLPAKVFFPKDVMKRDGVEYPSHCWMTDQ